MRCDTHFPQMTLVILLLTGLISGGPARADANPSTIYAGTSVGVFKSEDGGATWMPRNSGHEGSDVQSIVIDPNDPAILYAGVGSGVFKSLDGGLSWNPASVGLPGRSLAITLAIDPLSPSVLYAGACPMDERPFCPNGGAFKTTNGG